MATSKQAPQKADANISTTTPSQDYIDGLSSKLNDAIRQLKMDSEEARNAQNDYDIAYAWYLQLKTYKENIEETDRLSDAVMDILKATKGQSTLVGTNAAFNVDAIKLLVLSAKEVSDATEYLKGLMKDFIDKLDCINDPGLEDNVSIMALVAKLKEAIDQALQAAFDSITETLNLLKCAQKIQTLIQGENGLTANIGSMDDTLRTGKNDDLDDSLFDELGESPTFPLDDCDRDYYDLMQQLYTGAEDQIKDGATNNKKYKLEKANAKKTMSQSNHDAIKGALAAANAAKAC